MQVCVKYYPRTASPKCKHMLTDVQQSDLYWKYKSHINAVEWVVVLNCSINSSRSG